jgi:hypothetical protein
VIKAVLAIVNRRDRQVANSVGHVVPAEVAGQGSGAVGAAGVGEAVGPFAQERFDEGFGFAVGLRPSGACVAAGDAELGAGRRPGVAEPRAFAGCSTRVTR